MSEPPIDVNMTQVPSDILLRLVDATEEIRDLLRQKAHEAYKRAEGPVVVEILEDEYPLEVDIDATIMEIDNANDWPDDEKIAEYRDRWAGYKSECKKMHVELGRFITHLRIVGGDEDLIENAKSLLDNLLDSANSLEMAFDVTPDGRLNAMRDVLVSFDRLDGFVSHFAHSPHENDTLYHDKVEQWWDCTYSGYREIRDLVRHGKFVECFESFHNIFFSELETAMGGVVEALQTFEESSANEWLAMQNPGERDGQCAEYINIVFPASDDFGEVGAWPDPSEIEHFEQRLAEHKILCNEMRVELDYLVSDFVKIRGDKVVIETASLLKDELLSYAENLEGAIRQYQSSGFQKEMCDVIRKLLYTVIRFQSGFYLRDHTFHFRKLEKWLTCLWNGTYRILTLLRQGKVCQCIEYMHNTFLSEFERSMIGRAHGEDVKPGENSLITEIEQLKKIEKEYLQKINADQMERDTTRYVSLTTIATFFSSVTATTLQFTYAPPQSEASDTLRGVVNLFWFLSLVFSVSSGMGSLLGLTWRKSSIFDSCVPPMPIRMWFDKAPMLFLIIAAIAFVIGLNLFAYLSLQPRYVSFATNIFTGLHGVCLLAVTVWFIYQLKHESRWARWVRTVMKPIATIAKKPYEKYKKNELHLKRNFLWAFGIDNRVARLNYDIDWECDWPGPYLLSKLIRRIPYPIKKCWLVTKKTLSDLGCFVQKHICVSSPTGQATGDVERGESVRKEDTEVPEETSSPVEKAKNEFRKSLQKVFSEADLVMSHLEECEDEIMESEENNTLEKILWGYPSLVKTFAEGVRPALAEARERRRRERENVDQRDTTTEHGGNDPPVPASEVAGQDKDDTSPVPPQSSQTAPLDDEPEHSDMTQTDSRPDSQGQQVDNHPLSLAERAVLTASGNTEALEPTSGDPIPMPDMEGGSTSPNQIEEVLFTLENNSGGSRIAQSKEESGE